MLAFVATDNAQIYVIDMITNEIVHTIQIKGVSDISGLLVHGDWLFVTERSSGQGNTRLFRVDLNPYSTNFLSNPQTIDFGVRTNNSFYDLAINNGTYLAITAPNKDRVFGRGVGIVSGNIYFLDITRIDNDGVLDEKYVATLNSENLPAGRGKSPRYITSGSDNGEFLLSNIEDHNTGFMTVKLGTDANGQLNGNIITKSTYMTPNIDSKNQNWLQKRLQLNLQSASGNVLVEAYDASLDQYVEYAIVADAFDLTQDPHWNFDDGYGVGKQMGGKLAIIKDPFNKLGKFEFLGTTTPGGVSKSMLTLNETIIDVKKG